MLILRTTLLVLLAASALACGGSVEGEGVGENHWDPATLERSYRLVEVDNFPGEGPIAGIAHDGSAYWLAYNEEVGGYYDPNVVTVAKYDPTTATRLASFVYDSQFMGASGLAFAGDKLFLNGGMGALKGNSPHTIAEIDAASGEIVRTMAAEDTEHDLAFDGQRLLVSQVFNGVQWIDAKSYALVKTVATPFGDGGTQRGIAYRPGEIWLSSQASNQLVILDDSGKFIGVCAADFLDPEWNYVFDMYMTFAGERLAFVNNGRVHVYDVIDAH